MVGLNSRRDERSLLESSSGAAEAWPHARRIAEPNLPGSKTWQDKRSAKMGRSWVGFPKTARVLSRQPLLPRTHRQRHIFEVLPIVF